MAIGGFFAEMLAEGVVFSWINKIWTALKGGMGQAVVQEWMKTKLVPKGLDDESIFTFVLSKANMNKGGTNKKTLLIKTLKKLEAADKLNKTHYTKNFRLIVAMDAIGRGTVKVEKKDKDGKVIEVRNIPDDKYTHPGVSILEILADECGSSAEMIQFIIATGAMQDAPFGTVDEILNWTKKTAWPWISAQYEGFRTGVISTIQTGEKYYLEKDLNMDAFSMLPWWRKIVDPRCWWKMINF
jgi:hypothetical protein